MFIVRQQLNIDRACRPFVCGNEGKHNNEKNKEDYNCIIIVKLC